MSAHFHTPPAYVPTAPTPGPAVTGDSTDNLLTEARAALITRAFGGTPPATIWDERAQADIPFKPSRSNLASLPRLAQQCLIACGYPSLKALNVAPMDLAMLIVGSPPQTLLSDGAPAYNASGMFANLMLDAQNVVLRQSYNDGRSTFQRWMRRGTAPDFKEIHNVIAGEFPDPKAIPENGELPEVTLQDSKESYRLTVWAMMFSITWQAVMNDVANSFGEIQRKMGRAMKRRQNRLAYQTFKDNSPLQADGVALFDDATHGNLTSGALSDVADYIAAWNTMHRKMSEQTGLNSGSGTLGIAPTYCLFPPAQRGIILQSLGSPSAHATNSGVVNIWQQGLQPIEEAELGSAAGGSDTAHYLASHADDIETIEYSFLDGLELPRVEQQTSFNRLALSYRIYHAFGVKPLDYRGLQMHDGLGGE